MSSVLMSSQGMALATAMALSGAVILLTFYRTKSNTSSSDHMIANSIPQQPTSTLRSCISSDEKRREKNKKRVHFAEDVVDPVGNSEEFRRDNQQTRKLMLLNTKNHQGCWSQNRRVIHNREMPANRMALYNGILRNRVPSLTF